MNEKVKSFLDKKENEIKERENEIKERENEIKSATLIYLGLYEKEYSPNDFRTAKYPRYESQTQKWYGEVPVEVSDEEYAEICKHITDEEANKIKSYVAKNSGAVGSTPINDAVEESLHNKSKSNIISTLLSGLGIIIIVVGIIVGFVMGDAYSSKHSDFNFITALTCWGVSVASGLILLGFGEIIKLLDKINDKL